MPSQPAQSGEPPTRPGRSGARSAPPRRRRRRRWIWVTALAVLAAVGAVGWYLGARILGVRDDLVAAQAAVAQVRAGGDVRSGVRTVAEHSARAANDTRDPLWRAAEQLPNFGENLRAVRIAATALDQLAGGLAVPALDALDADTKEPVLKRVLPVLQRAAPEVTALNRQFADVRAVELMPQVREGVDQIAAVTGAIDPVLQLLPGMLGANGPRNYLLVAQSNAEVLALGGSVASQSLLRAADGSIAIVKQADSTDYISGKPVRTDIDKSAIDLYNDYLVTHLNTSVGRPDFPTAAKTIQAFLEPRHRSGSGRRGHLGRPAGIGSSAACHRAGDC